MISLGYQGRDRSALSGVDRFLFLEPYLFRGFLYFLNLFAILGDLFLIFVKKELYLSFIRVETKINGWEVLIGLTG